MQTKSISSFIAGLITTLLFVSTAEAQVYQWKDASGKTVFSDKPPPGKMLPTRPAPVLSENEQEPEAKPKETKTPKSTADRELEFRKRQKESQEASEKKRVEQQQAAELKEGCANNKRYLQLLESGERVALRDEQGERSYLDDNQREQEITKTRQAIQTQCK